MKGYWCAIASHGLAAVLNRSYIGEDWKILQASGNTIAHGREILETASHSHP